LHLVDPSEVFTDDAQAEKNDTGGKEDRDDQGGVAQGYGINKFFDDEVYAETQGEKREDKASEYKHLQRDGSVIEHDVSCQGEEFSKGIS
jgi:hypothetical protein